MVSSPCKSTSSAIIIVAICPAIALAIIMQGIIEYRSFVGSVVIQILEPSGCGRYVDCSRSEDFLLSRVSCSSIGVYRSGSIGLGHSGSIGIIDSYLMGMEKEEPDATCY